MYPNPNNPHGQEQPVEMFDLREFFLKLKRKWPYFLGSVILFISIAILVIKFATPIFKIKATLLISDEKNPAMGSSALLGDLDLFNAPRNLENEIGLLSSRSMIHKALKNLDFEVSYFEKDDLRDNEKYHHFPFKAILDSNHFQLANAEFIVTPINSNEYDLQVLEEDIKKIDYRSEEREGPILEEISFKKRMKFNEEVEHDLWKFKLVIDKPNLFNPQTTYHFKINNHDDMVDHYLDKLQVAAINKKASIIELLTEGPVIYKEVTFLKKLTDVYIQSGLDEKNIVATNTIRFIDEQILGVSDSLKNAEKDLQNFKSSNPILDLEGSSKAIIERLQMLENEKSTVFLQSKYYNYLRNYLLNHQDTKQIVAPSAMGINDLLLNTQINELAKLNNELAGLQVNSTDDNPYINVIRERIKSTKETILENLNNIVHTTNIAVQDINQRIAVVEKEANLLPTNQRKFINIQRKFLLNDNIYNYLLQKRAEAGIAKSANTPDNRIIDSARPTPRTPVYPKKWLFIFAAIVVGLIVPLVLFIILDYINNTISDRTELEKITTIPVVGMIARVRAKGSTFLINDEPKSILAESFRSLRSNLSFVSNTDDPKVIGITSSISGEGKTFFCINLGSIFSFNNKRVLLIEGDLRKSSLSSFLKVDNAAGLSNYLIGSKTPEALIKKTYIKNLDVITCGPIPPNPAELLNTGNFEGLLSFAKERYDYIIVDSSPIGLVADYYSLLDHIDINLFLVRVDYTSRELVKRIDNIHNRSKFKKFSIVLNDVPIEQTYGYGGYGYQNQLTDSKKFKFLPKVFN